MDILARFDRTPRRSVGKNDRELNISWERVQRILERELGLMSLKFQKVQKLTDGQKMLDWKEPRSYFACRKVASYRIWFVPMRSHSKLSSLWTSEMNRFPCQRGQLKISTCYWSPGLKRHGYNGGSQLVFVDHGVKVNAEYYCENVLKTALKPWVDKNFGHRIWTFQQDSERVSTKNGQKYLDINPLDFCAWGILESKVLTKKYQNIDHLITALRREWAKIT